jgi:hypothetical protein
MVRDRAGLLAPLGLLVVLSGCDAPAPTACRPEGSWRANMVIYDGTAQVTSAGGDRVRVELIGKGSQTGTGRWNADTRRLDLDLPSGSHRCEASADCRTLTCRAPGSAGPVTLELLR